MRERTCSLWGIISFYDAKKWGLKEVTDEIDLYPGMIVVLVGKKEGHNYYGCRVLEILKEDCDAEKILDEEGLKRLKERLKRDRIESQGWLKVAATSAKGFEWYGYLPVKHLPISRGWGFLYIYEWWCPGHYPTSELYGYSHILTFK